MDGSTNEEGSGVGMVLVSPEGDRFLVALKLGFQASNNEAEYEALFVGIWLAKELGADVLRIFSDSQLVVRQVIGEFQARKDRMAVYLDLVKKELAKMRAYTIKHVPREENYQVDTLARLASAWGEFLSPS